MKARAWVTIWMDMRSQWLSWYR